MVDELMDARRAVERIEQMENAEEEAAAHAAVDAAKIALGQRGAWRSDGSTVSAGTWRGPPNADWYAVLVRGHDGDGFNDGDE